MGFGVFVKVLKMDVALVVVVVVSVEVVVMVVVSGWGAGRKDLLIDESI